ncbi:Radical SAM domain protein [uncultured Alphaproteobacteria bacterium]|uniref:Radical SAM domain protein n=1 Tax=uncultured Alphaproteobacteria bacterium TaxID=91750 RepID=A0A212KAQ1_9PROT|nr:Radical SAM domain protein [uncultured Alphaproteobacteria bacterium]
MDEIPYKAQPQVAKAGHRAAGLNPPGRFESRGRVPADDGWESWNDPDLPPLATTVAEDAAKTVIARNDSPDIPFDRSLNAYRGCEHGCIYCYARPSHAFLGLSSGLDFETRLFVKSDAAALLARELRAPSYRSKPIAPLAMGTNTDPYQPIERRFAVTRAVLETLSEFNHPVTITTKSAMVLRDLDILKSLARRDLVSVSLSITTLDRDLARVMEPRATPPAGRLNAIRALADAGVPVAVMAAPMIPGLTDHELEGILAAAAEAGARAGSFILLRLPEDVKELFVDWLAVHVPDRAERVLSLIRQTRDGALDDGRFGRRLRGSGPVAELLAQRCAIACRKLGLDKGYPKLRTDRFKPPPRPGDQLALF